MARKMTAAEKKAYKQVFPQLDVSKAVVTGEATPKYNCISWTLGITSRWVWPGANISDFDKLYAKHGFKRSSNGPIAAWGHSKTKMTHGCISGPGHGPRWESKTGRGLRFQHGLNELVSSAYGRVLAFYANKDKAAAAHLVEISPSNDVKALRVMKLNKSEEGAIAQSIRTLNKSTVTDFEKRFSAWATTWDAPHTFHLSDPSFVQHSPQFAELVAMGPEILPLVIAKLVDCENFFALQLYDLLQPEAINVVEPDADDDVVFEGEQGRAERTVRLWLSNQ